MPSANVTLAWHVISLIYPHTNSCNWTHSFVPHWHGNDRMNERCIALIHHECDTKPNFRTFILQNIKVQNFWLVTYGVVELLEYQHHNGDQLEISWMIKPIRGCGSYSTPLRCMPRFKPFDFYKAMQAFPEQIIDVQRIAKRDKQNNTNPDFSFLKTIKFENRCCSWSRSRTASSSLG